MTAGLLLPARAMAANGESTELHLEQAKPSTAAADPTGGGGGGTLVRTIVGLAVVLGVIYGLAWVLRQVKSAKEDRVSGAGLQPIATLPLGPNRALHLVRAGSEVVLVGAGEQGVVPVRTYTEAEARALGLLADEDEDGPGPPRGPQLPAAITVPKPGLRRFLEDLRAKTVIR